MAKPDSIVCQRAVSDPMAIIGGPDAGKVDWHPSVVAQARKTGLSVDDDGNLMVDKPAA
jgi:hypothetical protein